MLGHFLVGTVRKQVLASVLISRLLPEDCDIFEDGQERLLDLFDELLVLEFHAVFEQLVNRGILAWRRVFGLGSSSGLE